MTLIFDDQLRVTDGSGLYTLMGLVGSTWTDIHTVSGPATGTVEVAATVNTIEVDTSIFLPGQAYRFKWVDASGTESNIITLTIPALSGSGTAPSTYAATVTITNAEPGSLTVDVAGDAVASGYVVRLYQVGALGGPAILLYTSPAIGPGVTESNISLSTIGAGETYYAELTYDTIAGDSSTSATVSSQAVTVVPPGVGTSGSSSTGTSTGTSTTGGTSGSGTGTSTGTSTTGGGSTPSSITLIGLNPVSTAGLNFAAYGTAAKSNLAIGIQDVTAGTNATQTTPIPAGNIFITSEASAEAFTPGHQYRAYLIDMDANPGGNVSDASTIFSPELKSFELEVVSVGNDGSGNAKVQYTADITDSGYTVEAISVNLSTGARITQAIGSTPLVVSTTGSSGTGSTTGGSTTGGPGTGTSDTVTIPGGYTSGNAIAIIVLDSGNNEVGSTVLTVMS